MISHTRASRSSAIQGVQVPRSSEIQGRARQLPVRNLNVSITRHSSPRTMDVDMQPAIAENTGPGASWTPLEIGGGSGWEDDIFRPDSPPAPSLNSPEGRAMWATTGALAPVPPSPPRRPLSPPWLMPTSTSWNGRWLRCDAELVAHMLNAAVGSSAISFQLSAHRAPSIPPRSAAPLSSV